jgi:hypothetical protein
MSDRSEALRSKVALRLEAELSLNSLHFMNELVHYFHQVLSP